MKRLRLIGCVILCGLAAGLHAADDNQVIFPGKGAAAAAPGAPAGEGMGSMSLYLGLALAAVGGWLVWRNRQGTPAGRDLRALAIDETRPLGNRQFLVVASYQNRKFLLGVCPGRIEMLAPLDGSAAPEKSRE